MRKLSFSIEVVQEYYGKFFAEDLNRYFKIERTETTGNNAILFLDVNSEGDRREPSSGLFGGCPASRPGLLLALVAGVERKNDYHFPCDATARNFIFSGIFLCMILTQQGLRALFGVGAGECNAFHRCTGWPLISAGLAGPDYDAVLMLSEASLCPCLVEFDNYIEMLRIVMPFMRNELVEFFKGENGANINSHAYNLLRGAMAMKLPEYLNWWDAQCDFAIKAIKSRVAERTKY